MGEKGADDVFSGGELGSALSLDSRVGAYLLSDGNQELQSLGINVSDLDTSLATR
jgi:hypothetical protein